MSKKPATTVSVIKSVRKRNGTLADFDLTKISSAAFKALLATKEGGDKEARAISSKVFSDLERIFSNERAGQVPSVEDIQDLVEQHLMLANHVRSAKHFILYRYEHTILRDEGALISADYKRIVENSKQYFQGSLSEFVYYRTYARWIDELGRRETWVETVARFMNFMRENVKEKISEADYRLVNNSILTQEVVPSMRLFWSSGPAARATNVAGYNCSFIAPSLLQDFGEIMYILMCGTGVGFSVERTTVNKLPTIEMQTGKKLPTYVIDDSKEGWADAFVFGLNTWFSGKDVEFDYSQLRAKGAPLKTMGGRSSGPDPLRALIDYSRDLLIKKQGTKLDPIDVHDIVCKIGEIVVAGGVRRSALISLSDLNDMDMRDAKKGQFWNTEPQRSMANNSAIYNEKPEAIEFLEEWLALAKSNSGERGIFNRGGLKAQLPERRWEKFKDHVEGSGTNPCGEIILRSKQFCNLTSIVVRPEDDEEKLVEKVKVATILGTYQASLLHFPYLSKEWKENCMDEALLGVSLTGYWDNTLVRKPEVLRKLRDTAVKINKKYAPKLGINVSTCVTCVKPSGNSSQLLNTSSGMHPRHSQYYIRRVRLSTTDPMLKMLKDQGIPCTPEVGQTPENATTWVLDFPVASPKNAVLKDDLTALEMLENWANLKVNFTEHNPSATISVGTDEWLGVADWVYKNWDIVGGLSFLPRSDHVYQLAPYEEITKEEYEALVVKCENVDFSKLVVYERTDATQGSKEYACVAGGCEL